MKYLFKSKIKNIPSLKFDEYTKGCNVNELKRSLNKNIFNLTLKLLFLFLLILIYSSVTFLNRHNISIFNFKFNNQLTLISSIFILTLSLIICPKTISHGFTNIFNLNIETVIIFTAILSFTQDLLLLIFKGNTKNSAFIGIILMYLIFNTLLQLLIKKRVKRNFKFVLSERQKFSINLCEKENISENLLLTINIKDPVTLTKRPISMIDNFFENSYINSNWENFISKYIFVVLLLSLISGIFGLAVTRDMFYFFNSVLTVNFMCIPIYFAFCLNFQLNSTCKKTLKNGSMIVNFDSIKTFSKVNSIVLDESDFYPKNNVVLREIKTFRGQRVDEAILSAATLVSSSESTLSRVFDKIIMGEKNILNKASDINFEENKGISGWVDGKHTIIGNRDILKKHGIDPPSRDYENKYRKDNEGIVYIAIARELVAMFILEYNPNKKLQSKLKNTTKHNVNIIVKNIDANISRDRISNDFNIPKENIVMLPFRENDCLNNDTTTPVKLATVGNCESIVSAVCNCKNTQNNFKLLCAIAVASLIIALSVVLCLAFSITIDQIHEFEIFIYLTFWGFISLAAIKCKDIFS